MSVAARCLTPCVPTRGTPARLTLNLRALRSEPVTAPRARLAYRRARAPELTDCRSGRVARCIGGPSINAQPRRP